MCFFFFLGVLKGLVGPELVQDQLIYQSYFEKKRSKFNRSESQKGPVHLQKYIHSIMSNRLDWTCTSKHV